ncbi:NAD(P)-dependent oxidoreductase [Ammoniphilus sp. CFH 90114]|uniref:NAD(P)-dependent oxidoreductase n=1 Tax=Ammoniphilus sp. CFH 90114 TaxID=2493665 RepID=UPI00100E3377|nr:NAD(P)-dependent oxidoreductase [Ammoniphilus sp. CFH 90114]RXT06559.1 NAD(P)-dependent oxidoreductase [Ammoniphilus sp. CFH 90114]
MKKIGFIGLGAMGSPIARNLVQAGYPLYVTYHRNKKPAEELQEKGAVICHSYQELAEAVDVIFTCVPDSPEMEEVLFGEKGLEAGLKQGHVIFDMSTIDLTLSKKFAKRLEVKGVYFFDAPISGGTKGAKNATLAIMAGGDQEIFEENRAILEAIGKTIVYCGSNGLGLAAKMANNLIAASQQVAISEALSIAIKAGIDPDALYQVLQGGTAASPILDAKFSSYLREDYTPSFKLELMCKDLNIITSVAKKLGTPTLVGSVVEQVYHMCKEEHGDKDSGAVALFYQEQAGVSFKSRKG